MVTAAGSQLRLPLFLFSVTGALQLDLRELTVELDSFFIAAATRSVIKKAHKLRRTGDKNGLTGRQEGETGLYLLKDDMISMIINYYYHYYPCDADD